MEVSPAALKGVVHAIPSKSLAHRALICAGLADGPTFVRCEGVSGDISATVVCLNALGADIRRGPGGFSVRPLARGGAQPPAPLPCGESGSTFRFMLPIAGALGRDASFILEGRLPERPLLPLYEELARHGCKLSPQGSNPFHIEGTLAPGGYILDAGVSSQFISGLLFALPLLEGESELKLSGRMESYPYIELTIGMLEAFGVKAPFDGAAFLIPGGQSYRSPGELQVEGDWSNAAFWLSAGAIGDENGSVTCEGLDPQSHQGDRAITDILARFGANVSIGSSSVTVSGGELHGIEIDARDIPDLVPVLAVVGAVAAGTTVISSAGRLRGKESDRLAAVSGILRELGADIRETDDGLIIHGGALLKGGRVSSWNDHRIAMAAAIAATVCSAPVTIHGAETVGKSYPGFFDDLRVLGGST